LVEDPRKTRTYAWLTPPLLKGTGPQAPSFQTRILRPLQRIGLLQHEFGRPTRRRSPIPISLMVVKWTKHPLLEDLLVSYCAIFRSNNNRMNLQKQTFRYTQLLFAALNCTQTAEYALCA